MTYQENYLHWLKNVTREEAASLAALSREEIKECFSRPLSFGTAGMRGIMRLGTNGMNAYTVARATLGLARALQNPEKGVVVCADTRHQSDEFSQIAAGILASQNIPVFFCGTAPVPMCSFAVRHLGAAAGIMITASHNPKQYNGYKVYGPDGAQLSLAAAEEVEKSINRLRYFEAVRGAKENSALITAPNGLEDAYFAAVNRYRNPVLVKNAGLSLVYTPLHGSGLAMCMRAFAEGGCKNVHLVEQQAAPDGAFPTVALPNPEDPAALSMAIGLAAEKKADIVLGTDPDCDRMGVAARDKSGNYVLLTGNQAGCLMLDYLARTATRGEKQLVAIKTIVTSELARRIAEQNGLICEEVLTGFKYIGERIRAYEETEHDKAYLFGFEESYGYLQGTHARDKDGVVACMLMAETAAFYKAQGLTLAEALQDVYRRYGFMLEKTVSIEKGGEEGKQQIEATMAHLAAFPLQTLAGLPVTAVRDYNRGVRIAGNTEQPLNLPESNVLYFEGKNFWACARPSGTEPKIKLYLGAEGPSEEGAKHLLSLLEKDFIAQAGL